MTDEYYWLCMQILTHLVATKFDVPVLQAFKIIKAQQFED